MNSDIRARQRFQNFKQAMANLRDACDRHAYSDLERAGLIQTFEIAFELAWKTYKDLLYYEGFGVTSPRDTVKKAFEVGYIGEVDAWLLALDSRNVLAHTYDKQRAEEAEKLIKTQFLPALDRAEHFLAGKLADE